MTCSQDVAPGLRRSPGSAAPHSLLEALQLGERVVGVGGGVDRPQRGGDLLEVAVVDVAQRRADEVHDAGLHPGLGEGRLDRVGEALQAVDAGDQDVLDAAAACRSLRTASQNLEPSVSCHQIPRTSRSPSQVTPSAR